ncbi:MAG: dTDP-4-dehydrorhamnose reductase, partial [Methanobrevibacter sp.]|nr:dTDP-4-dehydrorhamnose reductase [Candidatus Methanoflexus mossambicus]
MNILITGYKGMLGSDLMEILEKNEKYNLIPTDVDTLDITNLEAVKETFNEKKPDIVINVAAYTDVDGCETNRELAYNVNAIGPKNLAICCNENGAKLLHISTDYVFHGENTVPYTEEDKTDPINYYGETKLVAEQLIQENMNSYFILRTAWLYGYNGKNFVKTMLNLSKDHDEITVVNDQQGSPTFTRDLAASMVEIIESDKYGIYHVTNSSTCTWYEFTKEIFEIANINTNV